MRLPMHRRSKSIILLGADTSEKPSFTTQATKDWLECGWFGVEGKYTLFLGAGFKKTGMVPKHAQTVNHRLFLLQTG